MFLLSGRKTIYPTASRLSSITTWHPSHRPQITNTGGYQGQTREVRAKGGESYSRKSTMTVDRPPPPKNLKKIFKGRTNNDYFNNISIMVYSIRAVRSNNLGLSQRCTLGTRIPGTKSGAKCAWRPSRPGVDLLPSSAQPSL